MNQPELVRDAISRLFLSTHKTTEGYSNLPNLGFLPGSLKTRVWKCGLKIKWSPSAKFSRTRTNILHCISPPDFSHCQKSPPNIKKRFQKYPKISCVSCGNKKTDTYPSFFSGAQKQSVRFHIGLFPHNAFLPSVSQDTHPPPHFTRNSNFFLSHLFACPGILHFHILPHFSRFA